MEDKLNIDLDKCVACNTCQVFCPVATNKLEFKGPRVIGPMAERFRLQGFTEESASLQYCSNCKNCDIACPHTVPISFLNMKARCEYFEKNRPKFRDYILSHGGMLADVFKYIPSVVKNIAMHNKLSRLLLDKVGISKNAPIPKFDTHFRIAYKKYKQPNDLKREVALFPGCFIDDYDYKTGISIVQILNRLGFRVLIDSSFCCCSLPLISNGFLKDASKAAKKNTLAIKKYLSKGISVITPCSSCRLTLNEDMHLFFPEFTSEGYGKILDISEFLIKEKIDLSALTKKLGIDTSRIIYHTACHLRASGTLTYAINLLENAFGMKIKKAEPRCCGISGSYGYKADKYELSQEIGKPLFEELSKYDIVLTECGTCRVQIAHGVKKHFNKEVRVLHPFAFIKEVLN